ncbi:MAG: hypothetical protein AAGG50_02255 [Bacteroidota bacterium]
MNSLRLFPASFLRGHADTPVPADLPVTADALRDAAARETTSPSETLHQRVLTLSRHGGVVDGAEALHQALRQGWRVLQVRSEPPPNAAPLDFAVQVLLGRTEHHHVGPTSASKTTAAATRRPASSSAHAPSVQHA